MKTANLVKAVCVAGLAATCVLGLAACATSEDKPAAEGYTGGVAATVNGTEIPEDTITAQIQMIRAQMSVDTEDAWGAWLAENGYTPETVREQIISGYVDQELVRQGAAQKGVTVEDDDIEAVLNATKAQYDSEEAWEQALKQSGTTEEDYRHNLEQHILVRNLYATFATNE